MTTFSELIQSAPITGGINGSKGDTRDAPFRPISFIFMQFSAKILPKNRILPQVQGLAAPSGVDAPSGKSWIRHSAVLKDNTTINVANFHVTLTTDLRYTLVFTNVCRKGARLPCRKLRGLQVSHPEKCEELVRRLRSVQGLGSSLTSKLWADDTRSPKHFETVC